MDGAAYILDQSSGDQVLPEQNRITGPGLEQS